MIVGVLVTFHITALGMHHSVFAGVCFGYFEMLLPLLDQGPATKYIQVLFS